MSMRFVSPVVAALALLSAYPALAAAPASAGTFDDTRYPVEHSATTMPVSDQAFVTPDVTYPGTVPTPLRLATEPARSTAIAAVFDDVTYPTAVAAERPAVAAHPAVAPSAPTKVENPAVVMTCNCPRC